MKRKAGFTLIELVVAIVMACILLATLTPLLTLAQNGTYTAQRSTRVTQAGDAIYEYVSSLLKNAERVYIGDGGAHQPADPDTWNQITVSRGAENGVLTVNGTPVYPVEYQEGCALTLSVTGQSRDKLILWVALADNRSSATLYSKQSAFTLAGLEAGGFGQTEGLVGAPLSVDGFGDPQTAPELAGVGPLVIYFKGSGSLIPNFNPTPGGDHAEPTPGPSAFSVTLPSRMEVELGKQASLRGYVTWPPNVDEASKRAAWSLSAGGASYLTVTNEETGTFPTAHLNGKAVTDPAAPVRVTLTVTCTVDGAKQTETASCDVTVWKSSIDGDLKLFQGTGGNWDERPNVAHKTLFLKLSDYNKWNNLTISAAFKDPSTGGGRLLDGTWTSSNQSVLSDYVPSSQDSPYYSGRALAKGMTRLTFTASGNIQGGGNIPELSGRQTYVDIIFYEENDVKAALVFASNSRRTASVPFTSIGKVADYAVFSLEVSNKVKGDLRQAMLEFLASTSVQLAVNSYTPAWPDAPLIRQPPDVRLLPSASDEFQCSVPLVFHRELYSSSEVFPGGTNGIGAKLVDDAGNVLFDLNDLIVQGKRLSLTVFKSTSISDALTHGDNPLPETITVSDVKPSGGYNIGINSDLQQKADYSSIHWWIRKKGATSWTELDQNADSNPVSFDKNLYYYFTGAPYNIVLSKGDNSASGGYELYLQFARNGTVEKSTILTIILQ